MNIKGARPYIILFICVFLFSVVVHIPASLIYKQLPQLGIKINQLRIQQIKGTLWQGEAINVSYQNITFSKLSWDFQFTALLKGNVEYQLNLSSHNFLSGKGVAGYGFSGAYAKDTLLTLSSLQLINTQIKRFSPIPISTEGEVDVSIRYFNYQSPLCAEADGMLTWNKGRVNSSFTNIELGRSELVMSCDNNQFTIAGEQSSAEVNSKFSVTGQAMQDYQLELSFKPTQAFPEALKSQLGWLGSPDNNGNYQISHQGKW